MHRGNEDGVMSAPGVRSDGSSCRNMFDPLVRGRKPGSCVKHLRWLLVILLIGQASCNHTSAAPVTTPATTDAKTSAVYYFVDITVDVKGKEKNETEIKAWLVQVFRNNLESCRSPNNASTTAPPTSTHFTNETTLMMTATTIQSYNTTTTIITSNGTNNVTAATSTTLQPSSTTSLLDPSVTTQAPGRGGPVQPTRPNPSGNKPSIALENQSNVTEVSGNSNDNTTGLYQDMEVSCATKTGIRNTTCTVMLKLKQSVPPCCVLRKLCATSMTSSDILVVGRKADRTSQLETECNSNLHEEKTCFYNGPTRGSCEASGPAYVVQQSNTTHCGAGCSCSDFCNDTEAYYSLQFSVKDPEISKSSISSFISKIGQPTNCSLGANGSCPLNIVASEYKDSSVTCDFVLGCRAILRFARQVPICAVSEALMNVLQPEEKISYSGLVSRAAICENSTASNNSLNFTYTWIEINITPAELCLATELPLVFDCQNGKHLAFLLEESCIYQPSTTSRPNVTTTQPNTTLSMNVTSPPLNTTTEALNTTTTVSSNVTATTTLNNTTTTTASESISIATSESPTTTLSVDSQANALLDQTRDVSNLNSSQVDQLVSQFVPNFSSVKKCQENNTCSCSAFCNETEAYYSLQLFVKDPEMSESSVFFFISKIGQPKNCSLGANGSCPLNIVASEYKDSSVTCDFTEPNVQSCRAILRFARQVPICAVSEALTNVFQPEEKISYSGLVSRAAICENSIANNNPINITFVWIETNITAAELCLATELPLLSCQNGKHLVFLLEESCIYQPSTTSRPNITTTQPNTTLSVNVTSLPLNTTTEALNTTTTATTTATTVSSNVTAATTLNNTTTTTANESISIATSESPTTTLSADSQANALLDQTRDVSNLNSSQVDQLVSQLEDLLSGPTVSLELGNTSVHIVSNLLEASPEVLAASSNRIIGIVDTVGLKLVLDQPTETILSEAVALSVKTVDGTNFQGTVFSISDPSNVQVLGDSRRRRSVRTDSIIPQGSIRLPSSLTQDLTTEQQQLASRVQFNFYQRSTVFQDRSLGQRRLNSGILGASVANLTITGLQDDVIINLRNIEPVPANFVARCVFWDFTVNDGSGGWNSSGCFVRNSTDNETVCSCNHLTSFAILLDLSREPLTSRVQATILTFITYIGCGVSAIFLSVTLLTYLAFGKLRKDIPSKILIQLCLALLMLNLVFLVDSWLALYPEAEGLCISTAWFLHYFLLATFTWMGLEAVHMYLALVKVFNSYVSHYMLKFSLVGWGVPMIVVIIVIAIDKDNYGLVSYGRFTDGTSDEFCWLKNDTAFYVAVVAYFCVIFLFNFIMFIVVLIQLCRIKRQNPHNSSHRSALQDARSVAGITLLLGLTWGFAFFAWGPVNLAFMYLFAIFNSLQGFFIFVFHCAVKENVRRQWRTYLCCGKMRLAENSEWSRTATQKTMKKASVTGLTSLNSSKSNNSSSSSSFLVSESSEQINAIGSPFDDRTIIADEDPSSDVVLNEINRQYRNQQAP